MNIGSLIRGLLGEQKPGDAKTLELKPGQVVRGVVMNVSENGQEAVVQIQGVQINAKMETPLRAGETALLQVQPPGDSATAVLKPLSQSQAMPLSPSSMVEVLEFAGLPDTKENREMIRSMQLAGVPLTRENISQFSNLMGVKPVQVSAAEWLESAAIAFHRGLPVTADSVRGLHQAVFGPPLHQLLQSLEQQLSAALTAQGNSGSTAVGEAARTAQTGARAGAAEAAAQPQGAAAGNAGFLQAASGSQQETLVKLQGMLQQLRTELAQPWAGQQSAQSTAAAGQGQAAGPPAGPAAAGAPPSAAAAPQGEGGAAPSPQPPTQGSSEPWVGRLLKLLGAEHEQQALRGAAASSPAGDAARAAGSAAPGGQQAQALPGSGPAAGGSAQGAAGAAGAEAANAPAPAAGSAAAGVVAAGGQAAQASAAGQGQSQPGGSTSPGSSAAGAVPPSAAGAGAAPGATNVLAAVAQQAGSTAAQQDTIKGLLLQIVSAQDTPPALKEAAQQLVQHLTGQQLLLNTDRTAPFAQVTMFIPIHGPDGQQTASIHIQSRRGRKGELDSANCRLVFDLDMKLLGLTLIDVQVVDRIVSVNIRNDKDWAQGLFEQRREELAGAVESIGYQLLSLKVEPLPDASEMPSELAARGTASEYTPQSYKGVDMRI